MPPVSQPAPLSGMGSNPVAPTINKATPRFCVVTWNARALLARDPRKRRAKFRTLDRVLSAATAVLIQELHGTEEEASLAFFRYQADLHVVLNPGKDRALGGLPFSFGGLT